MDRQELANRTSWPDKPGSDRRVSHLKKAFQRDLSCSWSVGEMASRVNLSVAHLNRLFKAETGLSPTQFLRELRLQEAAALLKNSFLSVKEIRCKTGLRDKKLFANAFKKRYGMTPVEYRRKSFGNLDQ
jgi:transcriptional regulator GlxA family with amidase domain